MKRVSCFLLALCIMISIIAPLSSAEGSPQYYTIQVEYSDHIGFSEPLEVMIQNDHVYVNAKMLAERLGYIFGENNEKAVIFNKNTSNGLPVGITQFEYNSTQVSHMLFSQMVSEYEAPFASIKNSEGSWIPLEYGLLLINSGMMMTGDTLRIDTPQKDLIDFFFDIAKKSATYTFDWADDFGYNDTVTAIKGVSSHIVNVFNGVLECDGASWASLFQQFVGSSASYDSKYGEDLALLLCTESDKELQAASGQVEMICDLLNSDGDLGKLLESVSRTLDFEVGFWHERCETVLHTIQEENLRSIRYSRSYKALEDALDRQTWFSHTGGNIFEVQKGVSNAVGDAFDFLDTATKIAEIVGYVREFQNQDEFSLEALMHYLNTADDGLELPSQMKKSMTNYSVALAGTVTEYTAKRFFDHADEWVTDAIKNKLPLHKILGAQGTAALIAWNIASGTVPFIANGLSSADKYELALYSQVFQGDAFLNYQSNRDSVFCNQENITAENLYEVARYCYIYLKTCYVTREAALASLENYLSSTKEEIQPLIDYQNSINEDIAAMLVKMKEANPTNDRCVFGFLVSDNKEYLDEYDDGKLIEWIRSSKTEGSSDEWKQLYIDYLNEEGAVYSGLGFESGTYMLININGDDIPELYINYDIYGLGGEICTCIDGQIVKESLGSFGFSYIEGFNIFKDSSGHTGSFYDFIYTIQNGQFVLLHEGRYGNIDESYDVESLSDQYQWDGNFVSSEEYQTALHMVYDFEKSSNPFQDAEYDDDTGRYFGNGLYNYQQILERIRSY